MESAQMMKLFFMIIIGVLSGIIPILLAKYVLSFQKVRIYVNKHCNKHIIKISPNSFFYKPYYSLTKGEQLLSYSIFHPNIISLIRTMIAWTAILIYYFFRQNFAIYLFIFSASLDSVDGEFARRCHLSTKFGEKFDPFCDKLCYLLPIIYFSAYSVWPYIFAIIDLLISQYLARKILTRLNLSVAANNFGKIKAVIAFSAVPYFFLLDKSFYLPNFKVDLLIFCTVLSILSSTFKFIPNSWYADILSLLNLTCGIIGLYCNWRRKFIKTIIAVIAGQFCDLFDGRMAEKYGGTKLGPWLDDIADFVSFGLCPAYMLIVSNNYSPISFIIGLLFALAIFIRLMRFILLKIMLKQEGVEKAKIIISQYSFKYIPSFLSYIIGCFFTFAIFVKLMRFLFLKFVWKRKNAEKAKIIISPHSFNYLSSFFIDKKCLGKPPDTDTFLGLPSPGSATIILGAAILFKGWPLWLLVLSICYLTISRWHLVHFGRVILKKLPKTINVLLGALLCIIAAYNYQNQTATILPWTLLIGGIIYIIIGKIMKAPIKHTSHAD